MTDPVRLHSVLLVAAAAALLIAVANDVAVRTVPNLVSLIVAAAGLGMNTLDGQVLPALFGGAMVFAGTWYCWRRGWIGGGDVKLLSACALLVPPGSVPELILSTAISGGALALFYVTLGRIILNRATPRASGRPSGLIGRVWRAERRRIRRRLALPYACAIASGVLLTLTASAQSG